MTLKEAILDYLRVCEIATSKELAEVFGVDSKKVLRMMESLNARGEITLKAQTAFLETRQLVAK
jgi:Mn-dependent DtxR family transcriptional regulator